MQESKIVNLSETEIKKIERVNSSVTQREDAEASKEHHKKIRILFERAPEETLPFIVYVLYMGAMGLLVLFKLLDYEGEKLYIGSALLFCVMFFPLVILPIKNIKDAINWVKSKLGRKENL